MSETETTHTYTYEYLGRGSMMGRQWGLYRDGVLLLSMRKRDMAKECARLLTEYLAENGRENPRVATYLAKPHLYAVNDNRARS